jgi:hypothetical protein
MGLYEYQGPGPHETPQGDVLRPGDICEFGTEPDWGPWRLLEENPDEGDPPRLVILPAVVITPDGPQKPAAAQPPAPPPASPPAAAAAPAPKQGE